MTEQLELSYGMKILTKNWPEHWKTRITNLMADPASVLRYNEQEAYKKIMDIERLELYVKHRDEYNEKEKSHNTELIILRKSKIAPSKELLFQHNKEMRELVDAQEVIEKVLQEKHMANYPSNK
jgi:hypothetical protein